MTVKRQICYCSEIGFISDKRIHHCRKSPECVLVTFYKMKIHVVPKDLKKKKKKLAPLKYFSHSDEMR